MLPRKNRKNKVFRIALDLRATRASDGTGSKQCKRTANKEKINRQANSVKSLLQMFDFWVDTRGRPICVFQGRYRYRLLQIK